MTRVLSPIAQDLDEIDVERRFGGLARLYGELALSSFKQAHICVIGVGGVGSWVVEALARSAIGKIRSEEHTLNSSHSQQSRMPSSA